MFASWPMDERLSRVNGEIVIFMNEDNNNSYEWGQCCEDHVKIMIVESM